MAGTHNPLLPEMATVIETVQETHNIKTFRVRFDDEEKMKNFTFQPGQVGQLSVFGVGESTFVINSSPTRMDYLQFSVMKAGENTAALHKLNAGDKIGVRAPLGNWFPYEQWKGKNVFFIGGGIGIGIAVLLRLGKNGLQPLRHLPLPVTDGTADGVQFRRSAVLYLAVTVEDGIDMTGYLRKAFDPLRKTAQYRIAPLLFRREECRYFVHRTESRPQGYHILDIQKGACHLYFPGDRTYVGVLLQRKPRLQHQYLLQFAAKRQPVRYLSGRRRKPFAVEQGTTAIGRAFAAHLGPYAVETGFVLVI